MSLTLDTGETLEGKAGAATALVVTVWGADGVDGVPDYKLLARATLTTSAATIYTAPNGGAIAQKIVVQSIHASDQAVELWVNGSTDGHRFYKGTVKAGGANHPLEGLRLNADGTPLSYELNPGSGGGGGAAVPVQVDAVEVVATPTALDFTTALDVSDVSGVATIAVDQTELTGVPAAFVSDTHANRIAAGHVAGRLWRETNTGLVYRDNGTTWDMWKNDGTIRKSANETVNNSAALQNDDELFWPVEVNEVWFFEAFLLLQAASVNADWKATITVPAGATGPWGLAATTGSWSLVGVGSAPAPLVAAGTGASFGAAITGSGLTAGYMAGWVIVGATAGNAQIQWAQNTATVENSIVQANSFLRIRRLA